MSKKKFSAGLDSLFSISEDENIEHYSESENIHEAITSTVAQVSAPVKARRGAKNFSSDLGSAMEDSFVTSEDNFLSNADDQLNLADAAKRNARRPLSGLDALLRRTIESTDLDNETKRRIVLIIESGKVEKLKEIARGESLFFKDIIERSVNFFIDDYERRKAMI